MAKEKGKIYAVPNVATPSRPVIFTDKCKGCNLCVEVCPVDVYIPHPEKGKAPIIIQASLARKASSLPLGFQRIDYPELDPPEWAKFLTVSQDNGKVKVEERPPGYACNLKENYEAHNKDYHGVYKE